MVPAARTAEVVELPHALPLPDTRPSSRHIEDPVRDLMLLDVLPVVAHKEPATPSRKPVTTKPVPVNVVPRPLASVEADAPIPPDVIGIDKPERIDLAVEGMLPEPVASESDIAWGHLLNPEITGEASTVEAEPDTDQYFEELFHRLEVLAPPLDTPDQLFEVPDIAPLPPAADMETEPVFASPVDIQREWTLEIAEKEPDEVFESFTQALVDLIHIDAKVPLAEPSPQLQLAETLESEADNEEPLPVIVHQVAQKLSDLEPAERELVAPIVKTVAEAAQEIRLLQTTEASAAEIEVATERLVQLTEELFEALGIEYDEDAVAQFVAVMLRASFMPAPKTMTVLDLEKLGTHEVKHHFPSLAAVLADLLTPLQRMVGIFAVRTSSPQLLDDIRAYNEAAV